MNGFDNLKKNHNYQYFVQLDDLRNKLKKMIYGKVNQLKKKLIENDQNQLNFINSVKRFCENYELV